MKKVLLPILGLVFSVASFAGKNPKIDENAVVPLTKQNSIEVFRAWNQNGGMNRINRLLPIAAERAASDPMCDKVMLTDFSMKRSTDTNFVVFAECANKRRTYFDETELNLPPLEEPKDPADIKATSICEAAIFAHLSNPAAFRKKFHTTIIKTHKTDGSKNIRFSFEMKDPLGVFMQKTAICTMNGDTVSSAYVIKEARIEAKDLKKD